VRNKFAENRVTIVNYCAVLLHIQYATKLAHCSVLLVRAVRVGKSVLLHIEISKTIRWLAFSRF
jgi:hypothetical protein